MDQRDVKYLAVLLEKCRAGDRKALNMLCKKTEKILRGYFRSRFPNPQIVDELCQEAHVKLLNNLWSIKNPLKLPQFVASVALHVSVDYLRTRYRGKYESSLPDDDYQDTNNEIELLNQINLKNALGQFSLKTRKILTMWAEGYNSKEISEELGTSVSAVKMQIKRGLENLRVKFYM